MGGTELVKVLQNIAQVNEPYRLPDTAIDRHRVVWPHLPASEPAPPYFTGAPKACGVQADAAVAAYQGHANDLAGLEAHTGSGFLIQLHTESGCAIELEGSIHFEEMRRAAHPDCMGCSIEDIRDVVLPLTKHIAGTVPAFGNERLVFLMESTPARKA